MEWCNSNEFKILNDGSSTHIDRSGRGEGAPDISIVNKEIAGRCKWEILEEMGSDHKPILIIMKCRRKGIRERPRTSWAWKKADRKKFQEIMEEKMQRTLEGSLREKIEKFNEVVITAAEECIPKKKISQGSMPFWDEELTELKKQRDKIKGIGKAQREARSRRNKQMQEKIKEKKKEYWREFVEKLKEDTNSNKVWRTIKTLDTGIKVENRNEEMVVEGKAITPDKRKAESFIQMYHRINRINLSKEDRNKTKSINLRVKQYKEDGEENEPFQEQEPETAIKQMAEKKKGGFDRIDPAMIKHCLPGGKR